MSQRVARVLDEGIDSLDYLTGFGAAHSSEALPGAVPARGNTPRRVRYGLYPEQINGTAFALVRSLCQRTWLYKLRPSVKQGPFSPLPRGQFDTDFTDAIATPELTRFRPRAVPTEAVDWLDGLVTLGGNGSADARDGYAIHTYAASASMDNRCFANHDGELLITPERGSLLVVTEMGLLAVSPGQLVVVPKGLKFSVHLVNDDARGYAVEVFNGHFQLPQRGPIGSNGLADERHFEYPTASFEDEPGTWEYVAKFNGGLFSAELEHSPYDVVGWHGNYAPYRWDVDNFNTMGSVSWDHPDPSILTCLTVPRDELGNAVADVLFFPGRWEVGEDTYRPPYLHRNAAVEFSGIIKGTTKSRAGYDQGTYSITPPMTPHGIASASHYDFMELDEEVANQPRRLSDDSLWLMVESCMSFRFTPWALAADNREPDFRNLYNGYESQFDPNG